LFLCELHFSSIFSLTQNEVETCRTDKRKEMATFRRIRIPAPFLSRCKGVMALREGCEIPRVFSTSQKHISLQNDPASQERLRLSLPEIALERDKKLRSEHVARREEYPESAQPKDGSKVDNSLAYKKRLIYRSKQRGWLEVDLLLGSWATDNVMQLTEEECKQYEDILNLETLDIYNMITGQMETPPHLQTPIMGKLKSYTENKPIGSADPSFYAKIKAKMSN